MKRFYNSQLGAVGASGSSNWFLVVFGLFFFLPGLAVMCIPIWGIVRWQQAKSWIEIPAKIVQAQLISSRGSKGGTSYRATAQYQYTIDGKQYTGTSVSIMGGGSDNIGTFQRDAYRELEGYRRSGRPFHCYVNPKNPSQAYLYRTMRWGMVLFSSIFGLIFAGVGLLVSGSSIYQQKVARTRNALAQIHPDAPWLWNKAWAGGEVRSSAMAGYQGFLFFAIVWNAFVAVAIAANGRELLDNLQGPGLLMLLFPLVGLFLLVAALKKWLIWRTYGTAIFKMTTLPGVIGGELAGMITMKTGARLAENPRLVLECLRIVRQGKNSSQTILYQDTRDVRREALMPGAAGLVIPVLFHIPFECESTDDDRSISWRLKLQKSAASAEDIETFTIPVFKTAESSAAVSPEEPVEREWFATTTLDEDLKSSGLIVRPLPTGGRRFIFPAGRFIIVAFFMTLFWIGWTAAIYAMIHFKAPILFPIFFSLFDLLILMLTLDMWIGQSWIEFTPRDVGVSGGWFGRGAGRRLERSQIRRFFAESGMQMGEKVYYNIMLETGNNTNSDTKPIKPDGTNNVAVVGSLIEQRRAEFMRMKAEGIKKITVGKNLKERRAADRLVAEWTKELK